MLGFRKILCPTDYSDAATAALEAAVDLSFHFGAELIVLHVVETFPLLGTELPELGMVTAEYPADNSAIVETAERRLRQLLEELVPAYLPARTEVLCGDPAQEIVALAKDSQVDLIVMCTHGQTGWRHLVFGSVAEEVVQLAPCQVLVTRTVAEQVSAQTPANAALQPTRAAT